MNRRALERSEKALGKDHTDMLNSVSTLAVILRYCIRKSMKRPRD